MGFVCPDCGAPRAPASACEECGTFLHYEAESGGLARALDGEFWAALPSVDRRIAMGEANTPLFELERTSEELGVTVYAKLESLNPTCSFKDRGSALAVSVAADARTSYEASVVASTGNTATSVAAYAARAGLPCAILVPEGTGTAKLSQAAAHGADVFAVEGDFSDCFERARAVSGERVLDATAVYSANPYVASANRTVAFELAGGAGTPEWVSVPVGAGPLLGGTYRGFDELVRAGLAERAPSMLCVQARGCHPVVEAIEEDRPVESWDGPIGTDVGAIADPLRGYAGDGEHTRRAVLESGGTGIALDDATVEAWTHRLAEWEGVYAEPASAASVAAIAECDAVDPGDRAVALITGHGLKEPGEAPTVAGEGTVDRVREALLG